MPALPTAGAWLYDLHWRGSREGEERILAKSIVVHASLVSPDSQWVALAGAVAKADYGGRLGRCLWLASADGKTFYTAQVEGVRDLESLPITSFTWNRGRLWFLTGGGLFDLEPGVGRARRIPLGPDSPGWCATLSDGASIYTLAFADSFPDSTRAVDMRETLRRDGWPAWVLVEPSGSFRVAVGAAAASADLEQLGLELHAKGRDRFEVRRASAADLGLPFPYGGVKMPGGWREAYLTGVGPPGGAASELWLSEKHGERQIRLLPAMIQAISR
jgi:hypothetical protein